jgi:colanic acid biosynthesis glycosyl transferase WcaI
VSSIIDPTMKKILFITQFFYPDIQATSRLFTQLCEFLSAKNHIMVLCGCPLIVPQKHNMFYADEKMHNGVKIKRIYNFSIKRKKFCDRILSHIIFSIGAIVHIIFLKQDKDLFVITSDNPFTFIFSWILPKRKTIFISQDIYSQQLAAHKNKYGPLYLLFKKIEGFQLHSGNKIITISREMKNCISSDFNVPENNIHIIENWADTDTLHPIEKQLNWFIKNNNFKNKFIVMYSGRFGITQNFSLIIKCAEKMRDKEDVIFLLIGDGVRKNTIKKIVSEKNLLNIKILPYQTEKKLLYSLSAADVALILYNQKSIKGFSPSKVFNFMACGVPIITNIDKDSEIGRIIKKSGAGIFLENNNENELEYNIIKLRNNRDLLIEKGRSGHIFASSNYNKKDKLSEYEAFFCNMMEANINAKD